MYPLLWVRLMGAMGTPKYTVRLTVDDGSGGASNKSLTVGIRENAAPAPDWGIPAATVGVLIALFAIICIILHFRTHRQKEPGASKGGGKMAGNGTIAKPPRPHS
jgi:hypothetical protein